MESPFKKISRTAQVTKCLTSLAFAVSCLTPTSASAIVGYNLTDGNTIVGLDLNSDAGMHHWSLGVGGNQLNKQWFYYSIGNDVAKPINTISTATIGYYNNANFIEFSYTSTTGPLFELTISYTLNEGGFNSADILETISVRNLGGSPISDFNLFQYSDFNLLGDPNGDSVSVSTAAPPPGYDSVIQTKGGSGIGEVITQPHAHRAEAGLAGVVLNNLTTIPGYDLNNVLAAGPGDVAWAFQWTADIGVDGQLAVFKDKGLTTMVIPEPSTLALVALGLGVAGTLRRRKA